MTTLPPITLTRTDLARLDALLEQDFDDSRHPLLERLEGELRRATVVEPSAAAGVVTLGSRVLYENLESGQRKEVELVLPAQAKPGTERLSVLSPVGCSLIGLREGDVFTWDAGNHRWRLKVLEVRPAPAH